VINYNLEIQRQEWWQLCNNEAGTRETRKKRKDISANLMSRMASTDSGVARAEMSHVGLPRALALMTRRMILPDLGLGHIVHEV